MANPQKEAKLYSYEEYLEIEAGGEERYEYHFGEISALAGSSKRHNRIVLSTAYALKDLLEDSSCDIFAMDVKAEIVPNGKYLYPDIVLTCDPKDLKNEGEMMVRSPKLIVEVLSDSTEDRDRNDKFKSYIKIPSLQYYLLVAQNEKRVDVYSRQPHDFWHFKSYLDAASHIPLPGLGLELSFSRIYEGVKF